MARKTRTNNRTRRSRARRTGPSGRSLLGGPNSTTNPVVTVREVGNFDLGTNDVVVGFSTKSMPQKLAIYAVPPRDTDTNLLGGGSLARVVVQWMASSTSDPGSRFIIQENRTLLQYNKGPKLLARMDFRKYYDAGLAIPIRVQGTSNMLETAELILESDNNSSWDGPPINVICVAEHEWTAQAELVCGTMSGDGASPFVVNFPLDLDILPGRVSTNNSVRSMRAFAARNTMQTRIKALTQTPSLAGAAEAHPSND